MKVCLGTTELVATRKSSLHMTVFLKKLPRDLLPKPYKLVVCSACALPWCQLTKLSTALNLQSDQDNYIFNLFSSTGLQAKMTTPSEHLSDWQWVQGWWYSEIHMLISYAANIFYLPHATQDIIKTYMDEHGLHWSFHTVSDYTDGRNRLS